MTLLGFLIIIGIFAYFIWTQMRQSAYRYYPWPKERIYPSMLPTAEEIEQVAHAMRQLPDQIRARLKEDGDDGYFLEMGKENDPFRLYFHPPGQIPDQSALNRAAEFLLVLRELDKKTIEYGKFNHFRGEYTDTVYLEADVATMEYSSSNTGDFWNVNFKRETPTHWKMIWYDDRSVKS